MSSRTTILFLGATGYIGGSLLDRIIKHPSYSDWDVTLYVRSAEKAKKLDELNLGYKIVTGTPSDLEAAAAVNKIVINCASSDDLPTTEAILKGAKSFYETTGKPATLIHTSGSGCVVDNALGQFASEDVYDDLDTERLNDLPATQWHRHVDIPIIEAATAGYVKSYLVAPGFIYGLATGKFVEAGLVNPVSTVLLGVAMGALAAGQGVLVGSQKNIWHCAEIHEVIDVYLIIFINVLEGKEIPNGREGYYFVENGPIVTLEICKKAVEALFDMKKIKSAEFREYTKEELFAAADTPLVYLGSNSRIRSSKIRQLGWKPSRTPDAYLLGIREEIKVMYTTDLSKGFPSHRVD
ncbi:hypothetical protein EIP91_011837 [Steccherinum ochraceum]|uniref:NAD(P)-binding domain-containing protein n=1 Tax=Steccherinum ochraceum TaxID=92696 RepID=A0A4R0RLP4_9APHY|nr:hypothetical protein EIP91_011837 [Steccherinum ochraceum]